MTSVTHEDGAGLTHQRILCSSLVEHQSTNIRTSGDHIDHIISFIIYHIVGVFKVLFVLHSHQIHGILSQWTILLSSWVKLISNAYILGIPYKRTE